ncbi:serine/threonine protein phosphatase PrpC [Parabacteroides sp. PF5-5]|uniref:PP2C family protein-serine/threonine phosphatase n=1 Tax=unclassified Parabacteroides TaxID=2649774 RepID=UPI002474515A|nr:MULTISPECIES: protein phosphatase 2C domain-containing protein [unclassified Parabacteroides]MDH6306341.1 serine/threonine protein phosphatase PrpC [Parabacteroides sp. PH5-39]MDH6314613.1 serine/threonine protein phosphatase PrpC [Parabacteroides sp. PF5-13]MDH6321052.1 serine/threonine protein phosphatase PrpC [Parabacteroides sp. PH5-13]MDH6324784.1 serine/threonine protein phosphatase PrpC [Parabacteroides sp. PH5-8]MDH6325535.1 serine/threonine protein phosphatase PrpC [Parabacteroides
MNITIGKPCAISEKGCRQNNEDSIYPLPEAVSANQKLFLVCDGVGGAEKGEIASALACEYFQTYFSSMLDKDEPTPEFIHKALRYTEANFDNYILQHPEATGMATTLTMLHIGKSGITLAHIGDSRIYQFRNGKIINRTEDHSLVNSLVKLGQISPEEAAHHPQKNVITRAIHGTSQSTSADVMFVDDIRPGDYFFMCTDGVLESFSDEELSSVFREKTASEVIKDTIMESCNSKTRDNFSFYIIPIQNVQETVGVKQNILSFFYSFV